MVTNRKTQDLLIKLYDFYNPLLISKKKVLVAKLLKEVLSTEEVQPGKLMEFIDKYKIGINKDGSLMTEYVSKELQIFKRDLDLSGTDPAELGKLFFGDYRNTYKEICDIIDNMIELIPRFWNDILYIYDLGIKEGQIKFVEELSDLGIDRSNQYIGTWINKLVYYKENSMIGLELSCTDRPYFITTMSCNSMTSILKLIELNYKSR